MTPPPGLHHVVFCVEPDNQDAAADVWRALASSSTRSCSTTCHSASCSIGRGNRDRLTHDQRRHTCAARSFLDQQGEGVYSVVVRTEAISAAIETMRNSGAELDYRQSRSGDGYALEEAQYARCSGCRSRFSRQTGRVTAILGRGTAGAVAERALLRRRPRLDRRRGGF